MASRNYDDLAREELIALLKARDRRDATRFGLVWEANEIERDKALNGDFVALDLDEALSTTPGAGKAGEESAAGTAAWRNLIIEGDNFDALRYLRMTHAGRVKCIYIDPPYNTGNRDFVYNDRFVEKEDLWRHSKWCEFMFQRLTLARELLTEDGVIFVSIDDNEVFSLGLLMNRVFGEGAHVATCIWQKRYSRENRGAIGDAHEYLLVYARRPDLFKMRRGRIPLTEEQAKVYKNPNNDPRGRWRGIPMTAQGWRPNQMYKIAAPGGKIHGPPEGRCWATIEPAFLKLKAEGRIYWGKDNNSQPAIIRYLDEVEGMVPWTWWPHDEVGHTDESRKEIQDIFGTQTAFDTPKPVRLIERVLRIGCGPNDLVLDFFGGSGTTAHAVHKLNAEDGGNRRCILVSNAEATAEEPDKNLCRDVCAERVRRVIHGYGDTPGLGGDFAYLRTRRIVPGKLLEIDHAQVWTALQLIHREALTPFDQNVNAINPGSARAPRAVFRAPAENLKTTIYEVADSEKSGALRVAEEPLTRASKTARGAACAPPPVPLFLSAGDEEQTLIYVPRFRREDAPLLRKQVKRSAGVVLYSWQPELMRQHVRAQHVQHEQIPENLALRFGLKG